MLRRVLILLIGALLSSPMLGARSALAQFATTPANGSVWYGAFDAVAVKRRDSANNVFARSIVEQSVTDGMMVTTVTEVVGDEVAAGAGDLDLSFEFAGRLTVGRRRDVWGVEGSFLQTDRFNESFDINGRFARGSGVPGDDLGVATITRAAGEIESEMSTAEVYVYRLVQTTSIGEGFFLFGVRYLGIDDFVNVRRENGAVLLSDETVHTDNRIIGPQMGFVTTGHLGNGFLRMFLKGTVGYNIIDKRTGATAPLTVTSGDTDQYSAIGNLGVEYEFNPYKALTLRFGYEAMAAYSLALGIDNFSTTDRIVTRDAIFHMPYLGMILKF